MSENAPINLPRTSYSRALSLSFYVLLIAVSLVQVFGIFRGLRSPAGMDQAQIAREIARGNGFHTKFVLPYAWQQMIAAGKNVPPVQMPDTYQPPVQPLIWAPVFKMLEKYSAYEPATGSAMYLLDRVTGEPLIGINEMPVPGAGGKQIAFIHPESTSGVLVELYQSAVLT